MQLDADDAEFLSERIERLPADDTPERPVTVDLNGSSQYIGNLTGGGNMPNSAGALTNTAMITSTFVTNGGGTFGGIISGDINLVRVAGGALTLETAQTYTGTTDAETARDKLGGRFPGNPPRFTCTSTDFGSVAVA